MRPIRIASLLFACLLALPSAAQQRRAPPSADAAVPADEEEARARLEKDMAKKARQERHAALIADSDKLLKLAVELKAYVDKSNENVLSLDVIHRAEEIEKLAHSVKDKMKGPN